MRLIDFFDRTVSLHPDDVFLKHHHVVRTYQEAWEVSHRIAAELQKVAIGRDCVVGFYMPNDWRGVEAIYGALRAGAALAQLNTRNTVRENIGFIVDSNVQVLFFHSKYAADVEAFVEQCPAISHVICIDRELPNFPSLNNWMAQPGSRVSEVDSLPQEPWAIIGTSGTTGRAKCVIQTHLTSLAFTVDMLFAMRLYEGVKHLVVAPISHFAGTFLFALTALASTHVLHDSVDVLEIMKTIQSERIEVLFLPPTLIQVMLEHPRVREFDYSSLRAFVYAGAPMATARVREAIDVFGPVMMNMYGQSEANGPISFLRPEEHQPTGEPEWEPRLKSIGRASLMRRVEVMDNEGHILAAGEVGEVGEVVMRSWGNCAGYKGAPLASEALKRDGWLLTGDIGAKDSHGYVTLLDRKKDMIVSGGFNVYSEEVEEVLLSHKAVLQAVVIGVPDPKWGEAVKALVQLKPQSEVPAEEIIAFCKSKLGSVKAPKTVDFCDEFPRNSNGKILKREIRQRYWQGQERLI